ncbi:FAD-dependent monooxygenase [Rhodococcus sp. Q]|uniref:FAD-dependent oxidoreductase n=1 Tax=Rhodococcus sp. Q TaxID=2502252 RepID=UPI0020162016|nr:FAD-dependent monooxygenase [Rhodococcus sp. Q]
MAIVGEHAVVIGAGIGGLLAARVLGEHFTRVTVLERDTLPADPVARKCVPQGRHAHALLARGAAAFDRLFPGFTEQLIERGAPTGDVGTGARWMLGGHRFAPCATGIRAIGASRPLIEWQLRERVRALPNVVIAEHRTAIGFTGDRGRVTGVITRYAGSDLGEMVDADLVVDASGRSSQTQPWLEEFGGARPLEERMTIRLAYATRHFRREPADDGRTALVVGATQELPRGGLVLAQEGDAWVVTLAGYGRDEPPIEPDGFAAFAATLPDPEFGRFVADTEPLDEPTRYRIPTTIRRHYHRVALPAGYLPFGDAICCFNPIYGQGMSVAATEALALLGCLSAGTADLAPRFLHDIRSTVANAWSAAADSDLRMPCVEGTRSPRTRLVNAYTARVYRAASADPVVATRFLRVSNLVDPPTALLRPSTVCRVIRGNRRRTAVPDSRWLTTTRSGDEARVVHVRPSATSGSMGG